MSFDTTVCTMCLKWTQWLLSFANSTEPVLLSRGTFSARARSCLTLRLCNKTAVFMKILHLVCIVQRCAMWEYRFCLVSESQWQMCKGLTFCLLLVEIMAFLFLIAYWNCLGINLSLISVLNGMDNNLFFGDPYFWY